MILRVRKKGVLILPKKLREASGINEDSEVVVEAKENMLIIKPLKPPMVVDVDLELVEKILGEEYMVERVKHSGILREDKSSS